MAIHPTPRAALAELRAPEAQTMRYRSRFRRAALTCPRQPQIAYDVHAGKREPWGMMRRALRALYLAGARREELVACATELVEDVESWYDGAPRVWPLDAALRRQARANRREDEALLECALRRDPEALEQAIRAAHRDRADDAELIRSCEAALVGGARRIA